MKRAITLFSGGEGAGLGALAAGYTLIAGLEMDAEIAAVANKNLGGHVRVGDILETDPRDFPACDLLHASPPCQNHSVAKANGVETPHDIAMAEKVAEFIKVLKPKNFSLENVRGYRQSASFKIICNTLRDCGYKYRVCIANAADYGVPQTRIRLFVLASLDRLPRKPQPTHSRASNEQQGLFETRLPNWIGWYEAIEDLIPTLPESKFAAWQLARLPLKIKESSVLLAGGGNTNLKEATPGRGCRKPFDPCHTISTITQEGGSLPRAFIVDGQETVPSKDGRAASTRNEAEPMLTVSATTYKGMPKAFLVSSLDSSIRDTTNPAGTIVAVGDGHSIPPRAWFSSGHVRSMTPRALARFQSFPDWYELPKSNSLACRIIGNAVPPLMYQRILEAFE